MKIPPGIAARAAALRPGSIDSGTSFRAMAGGQPIYDSTDYSTKPDYTEALRLYDEALGLTTQKVITKG